MPAGDLAEYKYDAEHGHPARPQKVHAKRSAPTSKTAVSPLLLGEIHWVPLAHDGHATKGTVALLLHTRG